MDKSSQYAALIIDLCQAFVIVKRVVARVNLLRTLLTVEPLNNVVSNHVVLESKP